MGCARSSSRRYPNSFSASEFIRTIFPVLLTITIAFGACSTISRNLALMQNRGWVAVAETSATGRAMSVTITGAGIAAFTSAGTAWRRAQADAARMLGPDAAATLDHWLGSDAATPASRSD